MDTNNDEGISEKEINDAISVLEKAKQNKTRINQMQMFTLYGNYLNDSFKTMY